MTPRAVLSRISSAKNKLLRPEEFARQAVLPEAKTAARCYEEYQKALREAGGVDFDDMLLETLDLFGRHPDVAERYARGCRYLLVDEYQDTNQVQYRLVRALSAAHKNICVVADPDQSIYRFRGADPNNIADFERDHPNALVVKLEQNYRSTSVVLKAAAAVIAKNNRRHEKNLWTENEEGVPIHYHRSRDDRDEAEAVARILGLALRDLRERRDRGPLPHQQSVASHRRRAGARGHPLPHRRIPAVLRPEGDQGPCSRTCACCSRPTTISRSCAP
jgi:DNA helicase-2/ATP-dependent DNA helicase PcrA